MAVATSNEEFDSEWIRVNREGLRKLLDDREREFVLYELIQNAWDQRVTTVAVTLTPIAGRTGLAQLVVEDDDPDGFADLSHAYTLYAPSAKLANPEQRGRFNLGEKLVLALCEEAEIVSTTGVVRFDERGRTRTAAGKRERGSRFCGVIRMTKRDVERVLAKARTLIPPAGITTTVNGTLLSTRTPVGTVAVSLPTVVSENGYLRHRVRRTTVELFEPLDGEAARLYELGIPVVKTGDRWHYNVLQKVPLNQDRDNVRPAYLQDLRVVVLNAMHAQLSTEDANAVWARAAAGDPDVSDDATRSMVRARFGGQAVVHDPNHPDSSVIAMERSAGVIHGRQLSRGEWEAVRRANAAPLASERFPAPDKLERDAKGRPEKVVPPERYTSGMRQVVNYMTTMGARLVEHPVSITVVAEFTAPADAWYSAANQHLTLNVGRLGKAWFEQGITEDVDALLIHELGHDWEMSNGGSHRSEDYYDALCRFGARLKRLALAEQSERER